MMNYLVCKQLKGKIKCSISIGGISDLNMTIENHPEIGKVCEEIVPNFEKDRQEELYKRSPTKWVDALLTNTRFLLLHGMADTHVYYKQSVILAARMSEFGISNEIKLYKNDNHGITGHIKDVERSCIRFLKENSKK
ncbi:MAG: prolyl oligopeptidase family serine peptidase [Crocinitomicaceae bacterium]|nr:prolyl oligopeptidase family serine peptidase [Crocinitomicaceae bacterium]